jgi:hypothetical protein
MSTAEVASTYNDVIRRIVNSCQKLLSGRKVKVSDGVNALLFVGHLYPSLWPLPFIPIFIYLDKD